MKKEKQEKKGVLNNIKSIVTSKQFKDASKDLIKSLKDARNSMDIFK